MFTNGFRLAKDIEWIDLGEGISRKIFGYNDQIMLVKVKFETGAIGTAHQHPHTQASIIESGIFELTIEGKSQILNAGDGFFVEPNLEHSCKCIEAGVIIDTFSPKRDDFIQ